MPPKLNKKTDARNNNKFNSKNPPERLFVRPWDGVPSMPDGFAMLRGIEKKYGKIRAFKFSRDGEIPSTYFSYFWVDLEDPSKYSDAATTVLQIPVPKVERGKPGGVGIADLQPFLRPSLEAQEEAHEWTGVTERMVDEVDESKRATKVYDLRLEPAVVPGKKFAPIDAHRYYKVSEAFLKWGGFASPPTQESEPTSQSVRPTFDDLTARAAPTVRIKKPSAAPEDEAFPTVELHKAFNSKFDEPVPSIGTQAPATPETGKPSSVKPQSLLTMQREGKRLSRKQQALLQAAAISRTPLPKPVEKTLAETEEEGGDGGAASEQKAEADKERKHIQARIWDLVKGKWL